MTQREGGAHRSSSPWCSSSSALSTRPSGSKRHGSGINKGRNKSRRCLGRHKEPSLTGRRSVGTGGVPPRTKHICRRATTEILYQNLKSAARFDAKSQRRRRETSDDPPGDALKSSLSSLISEFLDKIKARSELYDGKNPKKCF